MTLPDAPDATTPDASANTEPGPPRSDTTQLDPRAAVDLLAGTDMWHTAAVADIPVIRMSDGPAGVRGTDWNGPASASLPCGTALAATFDPDLVREVGAALGREARSKSAQVILAPTVNLHRTPIGGRNFECMSEDPVHTAVIAAAYIEGVQAERIACCVKHFVGNDTEFARFVVSSEIPERVLRELYLVPFEAAVTAGVCGIMTGYNRLNGTFCSEHDWLLRDLLRDEWGFDGVVVSDWYGTHSTVEALLAGLDIEMPGPPIHRGDRLRDALDATDEPAPLHAAIDAALERVRSLAAWTGAGTTGTDEVTADDPATRAVGRRAATAAMVLLRNEAELLPLPFGRRVALIGPYAATGRYQGGGSAKVRPDPATPLREALRHRGFTVQYAPGCRIDKFLPVLRGQFRVELVDGAGRRTVEERQRLELVRQHQESDGLDGLVGARIAGTFRVDTGGEWRFGLRSVGPAVVRVDGHEVVSVDGAVRGGSFFGFGSDEMIGSVQLDDAVDHRIEVEYPLPTGGDGSGGMCGLIVGARPTHEPDLLAEAVAAAADADVAVVVVGTNDEWETEGEDRSSLALPGRQDELIDAVVAVNPNTVVVVNTGSPVAMPWIDRVPAVLQLWFPGGQLGPALTDVLVGDVEPGGRLPVTFPARLEDTPTFLLHPGDGVRAPYDEGLLIGHRWYERRGIEPLFWFGHGLGYTTWEFRSATLAGPGDAADGTAPDLSTADPALLAETVASVRTEVHNTGTRPGSEVVQVYIRYLGDDPDVGPMLRFAGSVKRCVAPGHHVDAEVRLPGRAFASWIDGAWQIPAGDHEILLGRSAGSVRRVGTLYR